MTLSHALRRGLWDRDSHGIKKAGHFQAQSLLLCVILIEDATEEMGPAKQDRGNILLFVPNLIG